MSSHLPHKRFEQSSARTRHGTSSGVSSAFLLEGDKPTTSTQSHSKSSMLRSLAIALAYLDAIAKTWIAFGEKLHESLRGSTTSSTPSKPRRQMAVGQGSKKIRWSGRRENANGLEFSLGDFLRCKLHQSSPSRAKSTSATPHTIEDSHGLAPEQVSEQENPSATRYSQWSKRLPWHGRRSNSGLSVSTRERASDKTLVLDLDETLIRASKDMPSGDGRFDFLVVLPPKTLGSISTLCPLRGTCTTHGNISSSRNSLARSIRDKDARSLYGSCSSSVRQSVTSSRGRKIYVRKRPYLREFLKAVSQEFEVVLFTAARAEFVNAVLDHIDPAREMIDHVLSRESCTRIKLPCRNTAAVVKDLEIIGRPLSKVVMVENSLDAIRYHLENGLHVSSFYGDRSDTELMSTLACLKELATAEDVRDIIISRYIRHQAAKEGHDLDTDDLRCAPCR